MSAAVTAPSPPARRRLPLEIIGGWEVGLIIFLILLYLAGVYINPRFFGSSAALSSVMRDAARYGVMAVGMTFVIVNKDLDLSVGSLYGLTAAVFAVSFAPSYFNTDLYLAVAWALAVGLLVGLINGVLVTILRVPAFIATLTMLFIGRGIVTGMSGGKTISFMSKAGEHPEFFIIGQNNAWGFNNQVFVFAVFAVVGMVVLAKTTAGYQTFATGGNELASDYAGIATRRVRMRAYLISAFCATVAGMMQVAQDRALIAQSGQGLELIVIAAVVVGGASILGGRGRVLGSVLGVILIVLIDKVLREGYATTRTVLVDKIEMKVQAVAQLPPGAVPAFLGLILILAVLIEPWVIRRNAIGRLWAKIRGLPIPPAPDVGSVAIVGAQTRGSVVSDRAMNARGLGKFLARRDAAAIIIAVVLWFAGIYLRPDFWGSLDNSFNLILAFTEVALLSIGLTFVIANGDIDLSVGPVLAMSGAIAAFSMKTMGFGPWTSILLALCGGMLAGAVNAAVTVRFKLPAFVATLGMFYTARGVAAWIVSGRELFGFPESFNLIGRKLIEALRYFDIAPAPDSFLFSLSAALSVQSIFMIVLAIMTAIILGYTIWGQQVYATGGNIRAAAYAGIDTDRVRALGLVFSALCGSLAGVIYIAFYRSFIPTAGQFRELDAIASVIIGGGSIFGGFGTIIGSLAGAAVITLLRALLSLQVIRADGSSFVLSQHWVNVFIGLILILAVVGDIWLRQSAALGIILKSLYARRWRRSRA
ncbi:MAG: ABC transporter permease [Alphaproteobacteria bacterium]|nr:MAG: ABC transporter permease [Alphaproteobacteria bacterium]